MESHWFIFIFLVLALGYHVILLTLPLTIV